VIVNFHREFRKAFAKLPTAYQEKTVSAIDKFTKNPRNPALAVHTLKGSMLGRCAFSVTANIRVVFTYQNKSTVLMLDVGGHDQVY